MAVLYWIVDVHLIRYRLRKRYRKEQRELMSDHLRSTFFVVPGSPLLISPKKSLNGDNARKRDSDHSHHSTTINSSGSGVVERYVTDYDDQSDGDDNVSSVQLTDDSVQSCCPFWCCCCCDDLPCAQWDWTLKNVFDKLLIVPLESLGRNAFVIYILAQSGILQWILSMFYHETLDNSLLNILYPTGVLWGPQQSDMTDNSEWQNSDIILYWSLGYVAVWTMLSVYLHHIKWYIVV